MYNDLYFLPHCRTTYHCRQHRVLYKALLLHRLWSSLFVVHHAKVNNFVAHYTNQRLPYVW